MASSSGGMEDGPSSPWRNSSGQFGGSRIATEGERGNSTSEAPGPLPPFSRERDRDKNYQTVCNLLSMLTLGVDQQPQNLGTESTPASNSNSTSTGDSHRMLLMNMANTPESCLALRRAGCIPLLIELLHPPQSFNEGVEPAPEIIRLRAARALKNIVQFNPDEKVKRKELRVLKLLEGIRLFSEAVRAVLNVRSQLSGSDDKEYQVANEASGENVQHPTSNITALMKLSFDEEHRNTMCLLGAIHALADLIVSDHLIHGDSVSELKDDCLLLRRYSGMTLTNLTFGDGTNKALLCGMKEFLCCLVTQLDCRNEDICQVTASVLRNLSWHADSSSRAALRGSDAVSKLTVAAINSTKESTLKATLSALWNLSAHSAANKSAICLASSSALPFLISLLRPNNPVMKQMKTPMTIIENAGGILRNISSQIGSSAELRKSLRENHCYEILLEHLKSSSLTVVSNACGTLWNLSGGTDCEEDQRKLLDLNAIPMLKSLVYSKHERISQGASSALRNLLSSRFAKDHMLHLDSRLTAQIYSPSPSEREQGNYITDPSQKSPGSDVEFDVDFNSHHQTRSSQQQQNQHKAQLLQRDPPVAHQQSSSSAASFFHRSNFKTPLPPKQLPLHFHHQPPFAQPVNYSNRPSTINYNLDSEPLDLTMTSAKSSPIHVISAAEFGAHSMQHQKRTEGGKVSGGFYRPTSHNQQLSFLNSPNLIHSTENSSPSPGSLTKYSFPSAKFNRSCPEILSRLQQNLTPVHQPNPDMKPLDYSSTSGSTASSSRGAGEAVGISNDSTGGGDTTFNYSLQYTEIETDDEPNNSHNRGNLVAKSDDTVKTYCYEGTPNNFSVSNSCQDLVQELEYEKEKDKNAANADRGNVAEKSATANKLQPIDEVPKTYYVENTPAVFSRTSSLSSINSSGGLNAGENRAEFGEPPIRQISGSDPRQDCFPPQPMPRKKLGSSILQSSTPARVTFSAEETPLMFSRCSSVASLDSLDVGISGGGAGTAQKNDDDLSDYSRRASEVVSPSDLPDSPRALAPPIHLYDQKPTNSNIIPVQKKVEDEDSVKIFTMEERSGLNSCRSLSPLTVDGEFLPVIGVGKLDMKAGASTDISSSTVSKSSVTTPSSTFKSSRSQDVPNGGVIQIKDEHNKPSPKPRVFPDDELKVFAMEGTPFYGVSNATSLSDLTMDLEDKPQPKPTLPTSVGPAVQATKAEESKPMELTTKDEKLLKKECIKSEAQNFVEEEPIYSDAQLLEKCIRVGKAMGIPKSQSEFHLGTKGTTLKDMTDSTSSILMTVSLQEDNTKRLEHLESKSQEFDDPDLAALIMIGRNRPKDKEKSHGRSKSYKKSDKETFKFPKLPPIPTEVRISLEKVVVITSIKAEEPAQVPKIKSEEYTPQLPIQDVDNASPPSEAAQEEQSELATPTETGPKLPGQEGDEPLSPRTLEFSQDSNQISTTSLGSEWNDETPTFSSPIPSMSISTAFRLAGSVLGDSMNSKQLSHSKVEFEKLEKQKVNSSCMNASTISVSLQNDLLENVEPPSTFSNLVSSSDCMMPVSPHLNIKSQQSNLTDRLNKKWRGLNDSANASSTHSNLSGQKPPPDFDLENSMISVASIKSEIYELSSTSMNNDIFESAVEELESRPGLERTGDISLGGNTYTIFPPENANVLTGAKSTDLSDGGNTVVSEDFTDAEDIEDFETAPADDNIEDLNSKPEKTDREKEITPESNIKPLEELNLNQASNNEDGVSLQKSPSYPSQKPLMEVHPLDSSNKYNTFVIKKVSMSPKSSPKQKRREDPERYKTRTINPLMNSGKIAGSDYNRDANGNPELKFATFRVGGPKIIKPLSNANYRESDTSVSPDSTPGSSPKGLRGRRKPLYSSLPPSSIVRKRTTPPPVPPKPARASSPARSTASSTSGVYVRPTRTSELRMVANSSRDNSPPGPSRSTSKNSSNSSLNLIHQSSRSSDAGGSTVSASRPRVAPKPPVRTTPVIPQFTTGVSKGFVGSTASMQMKTSNSSFGFGQQARIGDSGSAGSSMKGYSTLPKSSKLGTEMGRYFNEKFSQSGESKESIPGSEKSTKSASGMGKITNLWRKMDFRGHHHSKESASPVPQSDALHPGTGRKNNYGEPPPLPEKKSSKFSNLFGRKHKDKGTPKPFREPLPSHPDPPMVNPINDSALNPTGGVWVRRDGDNKVIVPPFNYTPPDRQNGAKTYGDLARQDSEDLADRNAPTEPILSSTASSNNAGSAKITTV